MSSFEVTRLFETGMYEYDNSYIYMPLPVAQDFASLGDAVTGLEVQTATGGAGGGDRRAARARRSAFRTAPSIGSSRTARCSSALKLEKFAMGFIVLLIVLVAAFNIVSTLTMVVADKTREIGILKAMGMPSRVDPARSSWRRALVIGVVGTRDRA